MERSEALIPAVHRPCHVRDTGAKVLFCKTLLKTAKGLIAKTLLASLVRLRTAMPASGAWSHERKRAASRRIDRNRLDTSSC